MPRTPQLEERPQAFVCEAGLGKRCSGPVHHSHACFFFFQAEDGIRDLTVTGVQTCALPILLLEDHAGSLDAAGRESLQRVRAASQRMGMLIDDLLKLARVTRVEIRTEDVDLSGMAREIAAELQRATPERLVEFAIAPGLRARGDARLLRVALDNLLRNSWKYTAKQPEPRIEFQSVDANGGQAFMVRDNGAGFDMQYADKLFGVFQRLHSPAQFEGTRVGLPTVRRIIPPHAGRNP